MRDHFPSNRLSNCPTNQNDETTRLHAVATVAERRNPAQSYWTGLISILDGTCRLFGIRGRTHAAEVPDQRRHLALGTHRRLRQRMRAQDARIPGVK